MVDNVFFPANAPTVDVIVVSRDRPSLDAALGSIAVQRHPNINVIVSPMAPGHRALPTRCGDFPLQLLPLDTPIGHAAAINRALAEGTGDWIGVLDDSDVYVPGHVAALLAALASAPDAGVLYSWTRVTLPDGSMRRQGQPFALTQLYAENFIHLPATLFRRSLLALGCRFDEALALADDWDMVLQLSQRAPFLFVSHEGAVRNAVAAWDGSTEADYAVLATRYRELVRAKWSTQRDALIEQVEPMVRSAAEWAQHGDHLAAEACCHDVLAISPNDPWALNLLASIQRNTGRISEARRTQELAVSVRPQDPAMLYNLALLCRAQGDLELARRCCDQAIALDKSFEPATRMRAELMR